MVSRVLTREGADPRVMAMFYKAVVQSVLSYGCETWVVTPRVLAAQEGFQNRMARRLLGMMPIYLPREDQWDYPLIEEAREAAGMSTAGQYIKVRRDTLVQNIAARPILELCSAAEKQSGQPYNCLYRLEQLE